MPSLSDLVKGPSLSCTLEQELFFVTPPPDPSWPSDDPHVKGTVLLDLPTARAIKSLRVVLEGACDVSGGQHAAVYETSTTIKKTLDIGELSLPAGKTAFAFSFIVPSNSPVYQRCSFGRVRHWVKATLEYEGALGMTSVLSSAPVSVFFVANPLGPGELPEPLELDLQHFDQDLGPIRIALSSPHFTIASLLNLRISLAATPQALTICSARAYILQDYELHLESGKVVRPPTQKLRLMPISRADDGNVTPDSSLVDFIERGDSWDFSRVMRVPDDDSCRPTTLPGSEGRIRVSHRVQVQVQYNAGEDGKMRQLTITKPITMQSCCTAEAISFLPAYSRKPPKTSVKPLQSRCLCKMDLKEMYDRDGVALERAGTIDMPDHTRLLGIEDTSSKSPAWTTSLRFDPNEPNRDEAIPPDYLSSEQCIQ